MTGLPPAPGGGTLPYGVNENDPHISGIWPIDGLVDYCLTELDKAIEIIGDVAASLDDQGYYSNELEDDFGLIDFKLSDLKSSIDYLAADPYDDERL